MTDPSSEHAKFQDDQFSTARDFLDNGPARKTLVIASSARSGSHLLGQVLHATGHFGDPLEYMHPAHIERWKARYSTENNKEALRAIQRDRTSANGVFAIKLHYAHLRALGGISAVKEIFPSPHVVVLRRRDTLKQAVSHVIAKQSGLWIGDIPPQEQLRYNAAEIDLALAEAIQANANWRFDLFRSGLPCIDLDHEDVAADIPAAVEHIARFASVSIPPEAIPSKPMTRSQSSPLNAEWQRRYTRDRGSSRSMGVPDVNSVRSRILRKIRRLRPDSSVTQ